MKINYKKLEEESIVYLWKYLHKKRPENLPQKAVIRIKQLILEKHKNNLIFAEELIQSPLFRLASMDMIRKNKAILTKVNRELEFDCKNKPYKIIKTMSNIINQAEERRIIKSLESYCEERQPNVKRI